MKNSSIFRLLLKTVFLLGALYYLYYLLVSEGFTLRGLGFLIRFILIVLAGTAASILAHSFLAKKTSPILLFLLVTICTVCSGFIAHLFCIHVINPAITFLWGLINGLVQLVSNIIKGLCVIIFIAVAASISFSNPYESSVRERLAGYDDIELMMMAQHLTDSEHDKAVKQVLRERHIPFDDDEKG